jgi:hypothetical protein
MSDCNEPIYATVIKQVKDAWEAVFKNSLDHDPGYRYYFRTWLAPRLLYGHLHGNYISCVFCAHLTQGLCHPYCFKCTRRSYWECSPLIPGTFSFTGAPAEIPEKQQVPWMFKTPCTAFERLTREEYFRNFRRLSPSITTANLEVLEGLMTGISRDRKPCHVCASVELNIYNRCTEEGYCSSPGPCSRVLQEIAGSYGAVPGMIKSVD